MQAECPPLAGIVHAAGENSTAPMTALDAAEVDRVFAGKVWGAWYLSEAVAGLALDFFLSTSSISSVWGSFGQSAYSAANAFLDGLTWRLREQGIPAIGINFGPWAEVWPTGMPANNWIGAASAPSRPRGSAGVRTLARGCAGRDGRRHGHRRMPEAAQGVVARVDWARFLPIYLQAGRRPLLAEVAAEVPESMSAAAAAPGRTRLVEDLAAAPVQQRRKLVLEHLRDAVSEVTRIEVSEIRDETGFFDLGMDSLMAVELRRRLEQSVGRELPATLAMDYPRLSDVADYLLTDVLSLNERAAARTVARAASLATSAADEPIAIIGVACRFPGSPDPDAYWQVLSGGIDAIREIPEDRFDIDEFYDPDQQTPGKIYTRSGGYLDEVDEFDPEFFGISPREAVWIDPQQRLMLEMAWEGLERAGYAPSDAARQPTGVFVGVAANEYAQLLSGDSLETWSRISSPGTRSTPSRAGSRSPSGLRARRGR